MKIKYENGMRLTRAGRGAPGPDVSEIQAAAFEPGIVVTGNRARALFALARAKGRGIAAREAASWGDLRFADTVHALRREYGLAIETQFSVEGRKRVARHVMKEWPPQLAFRLPEAEV